MPCAGSLPTAVETNTRSPHTIGLDTAMPATGVFHATCSPAGTFHLTAVGLPSPTPEALAPRNDGQFCADSDVPASRSEAKVSARFMLLALRAGVGHGVTLRWLDVERRHLVAVDLENDHRALDIDAAERRGVCRHEGALSARTRARISHRQP